MINAGANEPLWTQSTHGWPQAIAVSPNRPRVAVGCIDGPVFLFDTDTGAILRRHRGHEKGLVALVAAPNGVGFIGGGEDGSIILWGDSGESTPLDTRGAKGMVEALATTPGAAIAAGIGRTVVAWDANLQPLYGQELSAPVRQLAWADHGRTLLVAMQTAILAIAIPCGRTQREFFLSGTPLRLAPSPNDEWLACGCGDGGTRLFALTGEQLDDLGLGPFRHKPKCLDWTPDSTILVAADGEQMFAVNRRQFIEIARNRDADDAAYAAAVRPLGAIIGRATAMRIHGTEPWIAVGTRQGQVIVEDLHHASRPIDTFIEGGEVAQLAWTPDSDRLLVAMEDGTLACLWVHPR